MGCWMVWLGGIPYSKHSLWTVTKHNRNYATTFNAFLMSLFVLLLKWDDRIPKNAHLVCKVIDNQAHDGEFRMQRPRFACMITSHHSFSSLSYAIHILHVAHSDNVLWKTMRLLYSNFWPEIKLARLAKSVLHRTFFQPRPLYALTLSLSQNHPAQGYVPSAPWREK